MSEIKKHLENLGVLLGTGGEITDAVTGFGTELWGLVERFGLKLTAEPCWYRNHYQCYECNHEWTDEWSCAVDDECPKCGARACSPFDGRQELIHPAHVTLTGEEAFNQQPFVELAENHGLIAFLGPEVVVLTDESPPADWLKDQLGVLDTAEEIAAEENRRDHKRGLYGDD